MGISALRAAVAIIALQLTTILSPAAAGPVARLPSYATPDIRENAYARIVGRVVWFDGHYGLLVHDRRGYDDNVQLRQGTVITPTGLTLQPGMRVVIRGPVRGPALVASRIDLIAPPRAASRPRDERSIAHDDRPVPAQPLAIQRLASQRLAAQRLAAYRAQQYAIAHQAAQRLAAKLEHEAAARQRQPAHPVASVAHAARVAHVAPRARPRPEPEKTTRVTAKARPHPKPFRFASNDAAAEHTIPTYGWGKL